MSDEISNMIKQIEKLKNLDESELIKAFERGIISATKKVYGVKPVIRVEYKDGDIKFFWKKKVVENVKNEYTEINLEEAKQIKSDVQIGDEVETIFYPKEFGR
ncbi:MAG: NusA N-terminal domain-containing protein, partial [Nitrososphaeria archaeon]